jgi:hypothetical protein
MKAGQVLLKEDILAKMQANQERMMARMDAQLKEMGGLSRKDEATDLETKPEETESEADHERVPKEEVTVEPSGTLKGQYRHQHLAVRRCSQPKKQNQGNGGSWKKSVATCKGMTCHAGVARHKGHGRRGQSKGNVVQGTRKGRSFGKRCRTQPECNNGIRHRDLKERLRLGSKGNVNETFRETLWQEIAKKIVGFSVRIRKMIVRTLWRGWPLRNKRRDCIQRKCWRASATLDSFALIDRKCRMKVINLHRLAPYQGATRDKRP